MLLVFPAWKDNPYLNLMHLATHGAGEPVREVALLDTFLDAIGELGRGDTIHLNWTSPIVQRASTVAEAARRRSSFQHAVDRARTRGARLVWTVHNVLPHEIDYHDDEVALHRYLASTSDLIHIMSAATPAAVQPHYSLPAERVVHVPHPSYWGVYDQSWDRHESRRSFGLDDDRRVLVFLGQIRPYKGIDTLLTVYRELRRHDDRYALLLAGQLKSVDRPALDDLLYGLVDVTLFDQFVPDAEVGRWYTAADLAVFPYRGILNSGSVVLAATFGVPVLVPDQPGLTTEYATQPWFTSYPDSAEAAAIARLVHESWQGMTSARDSAVEWARTQSPYETSRTFRTAVEKAH